MQGWCDSLLTQKGILQAKMLQDKLKKIFFVRAYSSSSERVIDTANYIIEGRDIPLCVTKNLKEQNYGLWRERKIRY
ncbi:histidine phosphatase family protein [Abyssisolibacter fermentans]|uniref:histidine phosphatase family protein n=1 Tax=Abyssisolibacter fermentans TaxID=1766203 RepID=UPI003B82D194